ncbi:aldo/keto reductase [Actinoplanes sp. M2I2]|uniref:aldo/keto reductase n=1 Tax=Actinoplanes sp. M2I2 TaxID=1734444 RepID=UPI002020487D|nr:aldo/keto reductase [Actinoplanes sp. M2I2]
MALTNDVFGRPTRRQVLIGAAAAGAVLGAGAGDRAAHASSAPVTRSLRSGERLPAIGLGLVPGASLQVVRVFAQAGGRVVDTSRLDDRSEVAFASRRDTGDLFLTRTVGAVAAQPRPGRRIDAVHVGELAGVDEMVPALKRWKDAGRVNHVGVSHHEPRYFPAIEILMRNAAIDVVRVRYSLLTRDAEAHLLPLAAERGIPVIATMPMEQGRLHALVAGQPVPRWAAGFGATTWAQFFLKYVLAHPAVTVVVPSSSSPAHVTENMAALRGPLPDESQRARMVDHLTALTG